MTGFQIVVIILINCEAVYTEDPNNKKLITLIEIINYNSKKVPIIIIFKGVYYS